MGLYLDLPLKFLFELVMALWLGYLSGTNLYIYIYNTYDSIYIYMYICIYVCMYVCMYVFWNLTWNYTLAGASNAQLIVALVPGNKTIIRSSLGNDDVRTLPW